MTTTSTSVRTSRIATGLAVILGAAKAVAIAFAGRTSISPLESPLFYSGLLAFLTAFLTAVVSLGFALRRGHPLWQRVLAASVLVLLSVGCAALVGSVVAAAQPDSSWVWAEINLWVIASLALGAAWFRTDVGRSTPSTPDQSCTQPIARSATGAVDAWPRIRPRRRGTFSGSDATGWLWRIEAADAVADALHECVTPAGRDAPVARRRRRFRVGRGIAV